MTPATPCPLTIDLNSEEALWEWYISSDRFFMSQGACRLLGIAADEIPASMAAFLAHIPPACLPTLQELREGLLSGHSSFLEASYPFREKMVWERIFVLSRNAEKRALHVMGQYHVAEEQTAYRPAVVCAKTGAAGGGIGYWQCSAESRIVHMDGVCASLLGLPDGLPFSLTMEDWKNRMHPEDRGVTECHHALIFESPLMGDTIEDSLRIRQESGNYIRVLLRGAVLERNASGKVKTLTGSLQEQDVSGSNHGLLEGSDSGRLLSAISATGDGLWDWDSQTDSVYFSPRYLSMLGYTAEEFPGDLEVWKQKIHPDDAHKIILPQQDIVASPRFGETFECTYRLLRKDGSWAWILGRGYVTHRDASGKATRLVGLHTDITATQSEREQLEDLVKNDALTGLRSRSFCDLEMQRIEKSLIRPVSVIACDINGLKLINDFLGHTAGDKLLRKVALLLRHALRATDCVARMGGDEFVILLPSCPASNAQEILNETRKHMAEHNACSGEMPAYVSFGLATAEQHSDTVAKALILADRCMLREKERLRKVSHRRIKDWIEKQSDMIVSLEDCRYEM